MLPPPPPHDSYFFPFIIMKQDSKCGIFINLALSEIHKELAGTVQRNKKEEWGKFKTALLHFWQGEPPKEKQ